MVQKDNIVLRWNTALLSAVRTSAAKPPAVARAIAMLHNAMYDAWAHFDAVALPVRTERMRRAPLAMRNDSSREKALSYAAFRVLVDLFPQQSPTFKGIMQEYGFDPDYPNYYDDTTPPNDADLNPGMIGNTAARDILEYYHQDGSNQQGKYEDLNKDYIPVNEPQFAPVKNINHWQPLRDPKSNEAQQFLYPHWGWVKPFVFNPKRDLSGIKKPIQYPRPLPLSSDDDLEQLTQEEKNAAIAFEKQCHFVLDYSANLNDETKTIAEFWAAGSGTETPPGMWCLLARAVSHRDCHDLNQDVKLFFALGMAMLDASIACWYLKVRRDYCRPITAIHTLLEGREFNFWGGPFQGKVCKPAETWLPFLSTPPFAEYVSGHSTFSAAGGTILNRFTGGDYFGHTVHIPAGSSKIEPGVTPAQDMKLHWEYFCNAVEQAGISRVIGGIHFMDGNLQGQKLGAQIAKQVWERVLEYCNGTYQDMPEYC